MKISNVYLINVKATLITLALLIGGCEKDNEPAANQGIPEPQEAMVKMNGSKESSSVNGLVPQTEAEKISYMLGVTLANGVSPDAVLLDKDFVALGIGDVLSRKSLRIREAELQKILYQYNLKLEKHKSQQASELEREHGIKSAAIKESGERFLSSNRQHEGVIETASGVQYKSMKSGSGASPVLSDTVRVHYSAGFVDEEKLQEFDSSYKRNEPATFLVKDVITGWQEILPIMKEGAHYQVVVPASLAYGIPGITGGEIPVTATLVYELELLKVIPGQPQN